jgi:uncharacterized DUF497 family protein
MFNLAQIAGFDWDSGNAGKSELKHGVTAIEAEQVFVNVPLLVSDDARHSTQEQRWHALGQTHAGRLLLVTFTLRINSTLIRIISARDANKKERAIYDQEA